MHFSCSLIGTDLEPSGIPIEFIVEWRPFKIEAVFGCGKVLRKLEFLLNCVYVESGSWCVCNPGMSMLSDFTFYVV